MSRSIHTTWRDLRRLAENGAPEEEQRATFASLRLKRLAKRAIRGERRPHPEPPASPARDEVPVRVRDEGPYVVHPASPEDVREVLRRLPPGVTDGVAAVILKLGRFECAQLARRTPGEERPDPCTGRLGLPIANGIWCGLVRGRYRRRASAIELFAYVVAYHDDADGPLHRWLLRYEALRTLLHEVGHHHDHTCRAARGRWRVVPGPRAEAYARERERAWTRTALLPYLAERYPDGFRLLSERPADDPFGGLWTRWDHGTGERDDTRAMEDGAHRAPGPVG